MSRNSSHTDELETQWQKLQEWLHKRFQQEVTLEGILFLVGVQESGGGYETGLDKSIKERLVMDGTHFVFESIGLYHRIGVEADKRWIWERTADYPDKLSPEEQEALLKRAILQYFNTYLENSSNDT